jgi:DNA-binding NtrC family response regulator
LAYSQRLVIYVVHNDGLVRQTLLEFLADLGHAARTIASLAELLAELEAHHGQVDLVIAQLELLGPQGAELLRETHQRRAELDFLLITNDGPRLTASEAHAAGVFAYLREPLRLYELELWLARLGERKVQVPPVPIPSALGWVVPDMVLEGRQ